MNGTFTPQDLAEVLRDVLIAEKTGILHFTRMGAWKSVSFFQGMLVGASSSIEEENLPAYLGNSDSIQEAISGESPEITADPISLGNFLLERNLADKQQLVAKMRDLGRDVLISLFKWENGEFQMEEKALSPDPFETDVLWTVSAILKGIHAITDFNKIREVLIEIDSNLKWNEAQYLPVESLAFGSLEGFVISRIDGSTTVRQICSMSPGGDEERTSRFLYGLLVLGVVGWDPSVNGDRFHYRSLAGSVHEEQRREKEETEEILSFYNGIRSATPFEVLGIRESDPFETAKEACKKLQEKFRPERFGERVRTGRKEELDIIEARILEAFLSFQSVKTTQAKKLAGESGDANLLVAGQRRELSKTETQTMQEQKTFLAEQFFQKARESHVMGDYHSAIDYCTNAIRNNPGVAGVYALLANCQLRNPDHRWQKRAEENLQKAIDLDPWVPDHHVNMARFYIQHGMKKKAKRHLEKALEIQPTHPEASAELKRLK